MKIKDPKERRAQASAEAMYREWLENREKPVIDEQAIKKMFLDITREAEIKE